MHWKSAAAGLFSASLLVSQFLPAAAQEPQEDHAAGIYPVTADAYVRKDRANNKGDYENITKAHGSQYEGKGYKVLNAKENGSTRIIPMMKFTLPTQAEVNEHQWNAYDLVFHVFKNADPNNCPQTYHFYYTTDTDWDETTVTWSTKPASVDKGAENWLFDFTFEANDPWENKPEDEKIVRADISQTLSALIEQGVEQITVFAAAEESKNTSLMFHARESTLSSTYIQAKKEAYSRESLQALRDECAALSGADYTAASWKVLTEALQQADAVLASSESTSEEIKAASIALQAAKEALILSIDPNDEANIAYGKPTRSNLSKKQTDRTVDGDISTTWSGQFYPSYIDIDLMEEYALSDVELFFPAGKTVSYSLYGSSDGKNYDRLAQVRDAQASENALKTELAGQAVRILRVYVESVEGQDQALCSEVRVHGAKTGEDTYLDRTGTLHEILGTEDYDQTDYAKEISPEETYENLYGIVERTIGAECRDWFTFSLESERTPGKDFFEISSQDQKIHIAGNSGISIARGLNEYYKTKLNVQIAEETMQIPENLQKVEVTEPIVKETDMTVRYAFNYCTLSYTFAFFGMDEWQRENDWLALSGVNCVMDLAGQEAVWIEFLMQLGYSFDDARDWLTSPAYSAWQFMDNMESFGGPVSDTYIKLRLELARSMQRWKNSLGMESIMQGYAGMVPTNFSDYQPDVPVIAQGGWNGYTRPSMIATDSDYYAQYSELFYAAQEKMLGKRNHYYAVDPFHEGGKRPEGLSDSTIASRVLESLTSYDDQAVWVVQGWQSNPTNDLLKGMEGYRDDHVLIVDLIKYPINSWTKYDRTKYGSTTLDAEEFNNTPWVWGLLSNFGGNPSMHGQMQNMVDSIKAARKDRKHMAGIGIISEAAFDNPVLYDLIFDLAWADESFDLDAWLNDYVIRRYGTDSENLQQAWDLLKDTVYDHGVRYTNELFGCKNKAPQNYGKQTISYDAKNLEKALELMVKEYPNLKNSETYLYDLTEMLRQHISNYAVITYNAILDAQSAKDLETFKALKADFLNAFDLLNTVQSMQPHQLAGEWIGRAEDRAASSDDFTHDAFVMSAKALISSWGSRSSHRALKDYGWRNYEGMFVDLYKNIWEDYLNRVEANLETGAALNNKSVSDYFDLYWKWNLSEQDYTRTPLTDTGEIESLIQTVMKECSVKGEDDLNAGNLALPAFISSTSAKKEDLAKLHDGKNATSASLKPENGSIEVNFDLLAAFALDSVQIVSDSLVGIKAETSADGKTWQSLTPGADGLFAGDGQTVRYVRISRNTTENWTVSEIRIYGQQILPDLEQLKDLVELAETLHAPASSAQALSAFEEALNQARTALNNQAAPDEIQSVYWALYDAMTALDFSDVFNAAFNKTVTAHNDPVGHSERLTDGSMSSRWDAGRLSATGKPYESTITPGWAIVDLERKVSIRSITYHFTTNGWHHYTISVSDDGENWKEVAAKTDDAKPVSSGDTYTLENTAARYVRLDLQDVQVGSDGKRMAIGVAEVEVMASEWTDPRIELRSLLESADALDASLYTPDSWNAVETAAAEARALLEDAQAEDAAIEAATEKLNQAMEALEKKADKRLLQLAVDEALRQKEAGALEGLNTLVVQFFEEALAESQQILSDENASQEEVNAAWKKMAQAIQMLGFKGDGTRLSLLIAQAQEIDTEGLSGPEVDAFKEALAHAIDVLNDPVSLQDSLDAAADALEKTMAALPQKQFNTSLLELLVETVSALDLDAYLNPNGEIEAFQAALASAKSVLADPQSQEEIDACLSALHKVWMNLRLKPDESLLEALLAKIQTFVLAVESNDLSLFASASPARIEKVYLEAKETLVMDPVDEQKVIDSAANIEALKQFDPSEENRKPDSSQNQTKPDQKTEAEQKTESAEKSQNTREEKTTKSVKTAAATALSWSAGLSLASLAYLLLLKKRNRR